jgi:probable rRNA maturation factor
MSRRSAPKNPRPDPAPDAGLEVTVINRQRSLRIDLARIRRLVRAALPHCLKKDGPLPSVIPELTEVTASIVSVPEMSRVHVDFLGIEGPTDVITFPYGEILICAEIAAENAARYGSTLDDELALYVIHGLLHLAGFDDLEPARARQMRNRQAKILNIARSSG